LCSIPYITTSYDYKVELAKSLISNPSFLANYKFTILSDWFSIPGVYFSRPFLVLFYVIISGILILRYKKTSSKLNVQKLDRNLKFWIITFFVFQFLLAFSHLLFLIKGFEIKSEIIHFSVYTYYYFSGLCLIGLIVSPFFYPKILYGISFSKLDNSNCLIQNQDVHANLSSNKHISFDEEYLNSLSLKIEESMKVKNLFLQKHINLAHLSVELSIPIHHLSYYFSGIKKISFNDYRNMFRVEYAKELILDKKNEVMTLEAIALLCGFSDRNSFTTAFKKIEGTTPKLFASRCRKYM
jgi:AraC-like DNA-binding protein